MANQNHYVIIGILKGRLDKVYVTHDQEKAVKRGFLLEAQYDIDIKTRYGERFKEGTEVHIREDEG